MRYDQIIQEVVQKSKSLGVEYRESWKIRELLYVAIDQSQFQLVHHYHHYHHRLRRHRRRRRRRLRRCRHHRHHRHHHHHHHHHHGHRHHYHHDHHHHHHHHPNDILTENCEVDTLFVTFPLMLVAGLFPEVSCSWARMCR